MLTPSLHIRPPAVAGQFYPAQPLELQQQIEDLLARSADIEIDGEIRGLIVPHAGYPYSGQIAAAAYRQLRGAAYDIVVIMAPSHRESCNGVSIFSGQGYETPLGIVPVAHEMASDLATDQPDIHLSLAGHRVSSSPDFSGSLRGEHAIEVHLPFLQAVLPNVHILPILMDTRLLEICKHLADGLVRAAKNKNLLLIASSDLYHGSDYEACITNDTATLNTIETFEPEQFSNQIETGLIQACGAGPITTLMLAAGRLGATEAQTVSRTNSIEVAGQHGDYVVGYGAVLFYENAVQKNRFLTHTDRLTLGRIARNAVEQTTRGLAPEPVQTTSQALQAYRAAFVTLQVGGELRGCIGDLHACASLALTVQQMAMAAATQDPRFPVISTADLNDLQVEISALGNMEEITSPCEIEIGTHGLWIQHSRQQGLLLPQVAEKYGWNRIEFLEQTCRKALLPPDAWQHANAKIHRFSAEIFSG